VSEERRIHCGAGEQHDPVLGLLTVFAVLSAVFTASYGVTALVYRITSSPPEIIRHIFTGIISDEMCPDAKKIIAVPDNLNTHNPSSFYNVYDPGVAFRLSHRFEYHYTPVHASWLNIAECELSVMARQCLGGLRITVLGGLQEHLQALVY